MSVESKMSELALFDESLIPTDAEDHQLPTGYRFRPLNSADIDHGYLETLAQLTVVGDISRKDFQDTFNHMLSRNDSYLVLVIEDVSTRKVVGSGTLMIEQKIVRKCGKVGHIEDIVVHETCRGKQFGQLIIEKLKLMGKQMGCYKLLLASAEKNCAFYEKCGFSRKEISMAVYL